MDPSLSGSHWPFCQDFEIRWVDELGRSRSALVGCLLLRHEGTASLRLRPRFLNLRCPEPGRKRHGPSRSLARVRTQK